MIYKGGCHCGDVWFEVEGEIKEGLACNCSICQRKGSLLWFVPREQFRLLTSNAASAYTFNKHVIKHRFCPTCESIHMPRASTRRGMPWLQSIFAVLKRSTLRRYP